MEPIENFKALSYRLLIFGFQPMDLIIIGALLFLINLTAGQISKNALYIDASFLVIALYIAKKSSRRPDSFFTSLMMFIVTPPKSGIDYYKDVTSYGSVLENKGNDKN